MFFVSIESTRSGYSRVNDYMSRDMNIPIESPSIPVETTIGHCQTEREQQVTEMDYHDQE